VTVCVLAAMAIAACAQESPRVSDDPVVARVGDDVITESELESMVGPSLVNLRQQLYDAKVNQLKAKLYERLVGEAATAEGLTRADYLAKHVADKVTDPDEGEIVKVMSQFRSRLAPDDAQARQQVIQALRQQQEQQLSEELRKKLFAEAGVEILLEPPRVEVAIGDTTPSRGPENAPIVLVEYTDYQCPYCSRVQPTLDRLMSEYEGQIRHVFKNLPGEGALCAKDQDKFWELHDWLFANARSISVDSMTAAVAEMDVDADLFKACVEQGTYAQQVRADAIEARSFGITGTPGFLVNGRVLTGAQPYEAFAAVIEEELERQGIEPAKKTASATEETGSTAGE
jgi:protein-disulfide isomerase